MYQRGSLGLGTTQMVAGPSQTLHQIHHTLESIIACSHELIRARVRGTSILGATDDQLHAVHHPTHEH